MILLPDTSLAWNFHAVGRMDLVESLIRAMPDPEPSWAREVARECDRHITEAMPTVTALFGSPVFPTRTEQMEAHMVRDDLFRHDGDHAGRHLGESETIAIWARRAPAIGAVLILTEDRDFVRFCWNSQRIGTRASWHAGGRTFSAVTSADVLAANVQLGKLDPTEADQIRADILDAGRPFIGPAKASRPITGA